MSQIERSEQVPTINSLLMLSQVLDVSIEWLIGIEDEPYLTTTMTELDKLEQETITLLQSLDRPLRMQLVEILKQIVAFRRV